MFVCLAPARIVQAVSMRSTFAVAVHTVEHASKAGAQRSCVLPLLLACMFAVIYCFHFWGCSDCEVRFSQQIVLLRLFIFVFIPQWNLESLIISGALFGRQGALHMCSSRAHLRTCT